VELESSWQEERRFVPQMSPPARQELLARWRQAVEKA